MPADGINPTLDDTGEVDTAAEEVVCIVGDDVFSAETTTTLDFVAIIGAIAVVAATFVSFCAAEEALTITLLGADNMATDVGPAVLIVWFVFRANGEDDILKGCVAVTCTFDIAILLDDAVPILVFAIALMFTELFDVVLVDARVLILMFEVGRLIMVVVLVPTT